MKENDMPDEKKEAVEDTLREITVELAPKPQKKKTPVALQIVKWVFFPITLLVMLYRQFTTKVKVSVSVKMLIIYTLVFALILAFFTTFYVSSMRQRLPDNAQAAAYIKQLTVTSIILDVVFCIVFMALVAVVSTLMLNPIRKMSDKIDDITSENLSERLEEIDTQDEIRELTDRINEMLDNLEESFTRQAHFVSDASHELKTPIAVIQGYSNLLKRWGAKDPAILDEGIEAISRESDNMKRIVEQLLLLARLGKFSMNKTRFNLCEVLDDMVDGYRVVNTTHKITFNGDAEITVDTDKNMLLESVRTLVDNAIKYTPAGGKINVSSFLEGEKAVIRVTDTGVGISAEDLPKVFDRFYRCDKARGRDSGSSGLGLTIAKSIVEMMGGKIFVESEVDKGSTFTIELY